MKVPGIIYMRHHNNPNQPRIFRIAVIMLCLTSMVAPAMHSNLIEGLQVLTLSREDQTYYLPLTVNHSSVKLRGELEGGRSWLKEALCKVCDLESDTCDKSCFVDKNGPRISCDSSFCSEKGEYSDETYGVGGKEVEIFVKVGKESQVLMPLILANKLYQNHVEMGQFRIFDPESSFTAAILSRTPSNSLQLRNLNKLPKEELENYRQKDGTQLKISMSGEDFDFSFLKSKKILLHHVSKSDKYADFTDDTEYDVDFSLESMTVGVPIKLAKKFQKHLNEQYFMGMKCKLLPKRMKCSGQMDMQELFKAVIHFQLNQYQFMLPLHMLITACSSNECTTLINFDESQKNTITFGSVIWELYNLQYDINKKYVIFHRKITQFDDLFNLDTIKLSQVSFLYGLYLIVYHTLRYIFIAVFWLAILSVMVNAILQWRSILGWFRSLLLRRKQNRALQQASAQWQQFQQKPLRKINKLHDPYEDSQNI